MLGIWHEVDRLKEMFGSFVVIGMGFAWIDSGFNLAFPFRG